MTQIPDAHVSIDLPRHLRRLTCAAAVAMIIGWGASLTWCCWPLSATLVSRVALAEPPDAVKTPRIDPASWKAAWWVGPAAPVAASKPASVHLLSLMQGAEGASAVLDLGVDGVAVMRSGETRGQVTVSGIDATGVSIRCGSEELRLELER